MRANRRRPTPSAAPAVILPIVEASWILAAGAALLAASALAGGRTARRRLSRALRETARLDRELQVLRRALFHGSSGTAGHAQFGEDFILWEILGRPGSGSFLEAGAYDGRTLSISAALEDLGWRGILVEANPAMAQRCAAARPRARTVHAALAASPGEVQFQVVSIAGDAWLSRVATAARPLDPRLHATTRTIPVEATTLDRLLEGSALPLDLLILDVEGSELAALAGWDARAHRARAALIEDTHDAPAITAHMAARGYTAAGRLGCSTLFIAEEEGETRARALAILPRAQP